MGLVHFLVGMIIFKQPRLAHRAPYFSHEYLYIVVPSDPNITLSKEWWIFLPSPFCKLIYHPKTILSG